MRNIYDIKREWNVPGWTEKWGGWTSLTGGFTKYLPEDHSIHKSPEDYVEVFNNFDELYNAAKDYEYIIADKTPFKKKRRITFSGYWWLGESFVIIEGKHENCFPIKTRFVSKLDKRTNTIKELANTLDAEDFCQYLVDHGVGVKNDECEQ